MSRGDPAKHTHNRRSDQKAINCIEGIFLHNKMIEPELKSDDKYPNIDGYLTLLDRDERPIIGKIQIQVKTLKKFESKKKITQYLNDTFLAYCEEIQQLPIIFIGVDIKNQIAYWEEIDRKLVENLKGNTIYLDPKKNISKDNDKYYKIWKKRVLENKQAIKEYEERKIKNQEIENSTVREKSSAKLIVNTAASLKKIFIDNELKYKYYYPFVNLLEPLYLDERGNLEREKLREIFEISISQENEFVSRMKKEKLIKIVGNLCVVTNKQLANDLQNEMFNEGAITLSNILDLFK